MKISIFKAGNCFSLYRLQGISEGRNSLCDGGPLRTAVPLGQMLGSAVKHYHTSDVMPSIHQCFLSRFYHANIKNLSIYYPHVFSLDTLCFISNDETTRFKYLCVFTCTPTPADGSLLYVSHVGWESILLYAIHFSGGSRCEMDVWSFLPLVKCRSLQALLAFIKMSQSCHLMKQSWQVDACGVDIHLPLLKVELTLEFLCL